MAQLYIDARGVVPTPMAGSATLRHLQTLLGDVVSVFCLCLSHIQWYHTVVSSCGWLSCDRPGRGKRCNITAYELILCFQSMNACLQDTFHNQSLKPCAWSGRMLLLWAPILTSMYKMSNCCRMCCCRACFHVACLLLELQTDVSTTCYLLHVCRMICTWKACTSCPHSGACLVSTCCHGSASCV